MKPSASHCLLAASLAALAFACGGCPLFSFGGGERDIARPVAPTGPTSPPTRPATVPAATDDDDAPPDMLTAQRRDGYDPPRIGRANGRLLEAKMVQVNHQQLTLTELLRPMQPQIKALRSAYPMPSDFTAAVRPRLQGALRNRVITMLLLQKAQQVLEPHELELVTRRVVGRLAADRQELAGKGNPPLTRRQFEDQLKARGTNVFEYRRRLQEQYTIETLIRKEMLPQIAVRPSEALAYFKLVRGERYGTETTVTRRMIVFYFDRPEDKKAKRKKAEAALAKLKAGTPFADVAREHSEGIYAEEGGLWPDAVHKSSMVNQSEAEALFALKAGEHTAILDSGGALTLLYCERRNEPKTFQDVQEEIVVKLRQRKMARHYDAYVTRLWQQAFISEEAYENATAPFIESAIQSLLQQ